MLLVRAALPGTARITEVDLDVGGNREALVGMHLFALIPGQGASQLLRQLADVLGKRSNNSRRVLAGDLDEHREAGIALDEGGDVRVVRSGKKVSFPMPRHGAILNLGGPLADGGHIEDMPRPLFALWLLGRRIRRAVRNCAVSSFFSTPRVWMKRLR